MREADVSDEVLIGVSDNVTTANCAIIENPEASKILTDENSTEPKHLETLTNEQIDDLTMNTCKIKTHTNKSFGK